MHTKTRKYVCVRGGGHIIVLRIVTFENCHPRNDFAIWSESSEHEYNGLLVT